MEARFRVQLKLALSVHFLVLLISFRNYDGLEEVDCQPNNIKVSFLISSLNLTTSLIFCSYTVSNSGEEGRNQQKKEIIS